MNLFARLFGPPVASVRPEMLAGRLKGPRAALLLDVRQPEEYRAGHIAGARLVPLDQLAQRASELPRDREVVCVCRSGARSGRAARQLTAAGYQAANLAGGMLAWQRAGLPVQGGVRRPAGR